MKARIEDIATDSMREVLDNGGVVIAAGFQGIDENNNITTLGRGGSDTTAVALAAALKADECQIYTDVRSEEHTSELQSRPHLVCRLLLEKKKKHGVYT